MDQKPYMSEPRAEPGITTVPDILHVICEHSTSYTCVQIAYSSRAFYHVAIPYVWKELRGVHNLFSLIPGISILQDSGNQKSIIVSDKVPPDFSRYDIYAPLVHSLKVFDSVSRRYRVTFASWAALLKYSGQLGGDLLPNLRKLVVHCEWCPLADRINWIAIFLAHTLLEIQVSADATNGILGMPDSRASALLELVTQRCPSVRSLSFFPEPDDTYKYITQDIVPLAPIIMSFEHLANIQNLRSLTISKVALQSDALVTIGLLSTLEQLEIHDSASQDIFSTPLPEFLFPSLRSLTLQMIDSFEVGQVWQMQPLVTRLTRVHINAKSSNMERERGEGLVGMIHQLPRMQIENSSRVESLSINFDILSASYDIQKLDPSSLTSLFRLPLRYLNLSMVKLKRFDVFCELLADSCPTLRKLHIPNQPLVLSELYSLTRLENLKHISTRVLWQNLPEQKKSDWTRSSRALVSLTYHHSRSQGLEYSSSITATQIAMYFLEIWPNLTDIVPAAGLDGSKEALPQRVAQSMADIRAALHCTCNMCTRQASKTA
ncbi:hypothetical protein FS749_001707 [Ceratobasidium sp. UAMH 11750]|nr:hypothetical protein FS749_001707 [Ceratobasidium sp. UAMH 11750]